MTRLAATILVIALSGASVPIMATNAGAQDLSTFGILAGSTITNTGASVINGNIGVSPGAAIVGLGTTPSPGVVNGSIYAADTVAAMAQADLTTLYNVLAGRPATQNLAPELGGQVLGPGIYAMGTAELNGTLTLQGDADSIFIFNIESTLITGTGSTVVVEAPAQAGNVFFRVGSSATLGQDTTFNGQIVALTAITLVNSSDIICGAALARNAAVTLDTNTITVCSLTAASFVDALDDDDVTPTDNEQAVADALDAYVDNGGTLPAGFSILAATLTPEELAAALAQLAGETSTGVAPAGTQAMDSFLSLLNSRFDDRFSPVQDTAPANDTVRALGYGEERKTLGTGTAFTAFDAPPQDPRTWSIWAAAYGGHNNTTGDALVGTHDRSSNVSGVAGGIDFRVTPDTKVGLAISGGGTNFSLTDGMGSGHSDMVQAAVYGRTNVDAAYVAAALAYAWHGVTTERTVTVAGEDRFASAFSATDIAGQIEGGYHIGWVTPYAALRAQAFHTPAYSETVVAGVPTFALDYEEQTTTTVRTELGIRLNPTVALHDHAALALSAGAAWAHYYGSSSSSTAMFQVLGEDSTFTVQGAAPATDSLLLSAGAELRFENGLSFAGLFDSEFAEGLQTYAGTGRIRLTW